MPHFFHLIFLKWDWRRVRHANCDKTRLIQASLRRNDSEIHVSVKKKSIIEYARLSCDLLFQICKNCHLGGFGIRLHNFDEFHRNTIALIWILMKILHPKIVSSREIIIRDVFLVVVVLYLFVCFFTRCHKFYEMVEIENYNITDEQQRKTSLNAINHKEKKTLLKLP